MRFLALAALLAAVACASPESAPSASAQQAQTAPTYQDARSTASDEAVRDARRAYRAACQQSRSDAWCECMTGGMAQALPPQDLAIATAAFTGAGIEASSEARARVASTRGDVEQSCQQYR